MYMTTWYYMDKEPQILPCAFSLFHFHVNACMCMCVCMVACVWAHVCECAGHVEAGDQEPSSVASLPQSNLELSDLASSAGPLLWGKPLLCFLRLELQAGLHAYQALVRFAQQGL